ncbi:MAG: DsbA family protein [Rhizobiales bacterium]|jgi:protein-disulfide isomerase|nr:DsbA family protein [Hyphomicrobiales bacterium]
MTRRKFLAAGAAVTVAGAFMAALPQSDFISAALAQGPSIDELMKPGALPDEVQGKADAPVTIVEYASMTCSHCAAFHTGTYAAMKARYIDTGKVRYILREFPLDPLAAGAFMLARCAGDGKYYPMVDALFTKQKDWAFVQNPIPNLLKIAKTFGFTDQSFEQCLSNQKMLDGIEETRQRAAQKLGVNSTPTFFINGKVHRGAMTIEELEKEIQPFLKS